ncbi:AMP-dependent synthetase/ligase [Arenicella sp. 4NH20-0111]|uniref:AMP-dependent synthetase/ligase n=1 Tax=Arenicella sp. 4NH20-0111 TaxID=3127648 RepID=UPI00333FAA6E
MNTEGVDMINGQDVHTLDELFRERVRRSNNAIAYSQCPPRSKEWQNITWAELAGEVERWQLAFKDSGLQKGDRVAICYRNSIEWVIFDQAALRLGLVVVPLYTADRADNVGYVIADSQAKLVLFANVAAWKKVEECEECTECVETVLIIEGESSNEIKTIHDWLPATGAHLERGMAQPDDLASIVYTSGTTGRPKGVMLSHKNMLSNAYCGMRSVALTPRDRLLSFLPLSHTFERTVGYYAAMMSGAHVTFNRSIPELASDLKIVKPTVMISVPRIFERVHNQIYTGLKKETAFKQKLFHLAVKAGWARFCYQQKISKWRPLVLLAGVLDRLVGAKVRDKLGGEMNYVVIGGAPMPVDVAKTFIALGIPLLQGFGLTESSPVVSVNTPEACRPDSIGLPLRGVTVKLEENDELWVQGDNIMLGYWRNQEATDNTIVEDASGRWLKTGDRASIDDDGFIRIIGRIKDILVMANGENVPPTDIEAAIMRNPLFEQVMVLGEGKSFLSALVVLEKENFAELCVQHGFDPSDTDNSKLNAVLVRLVTNQMSKFPGYARIRKVYVCPHEWTVESGLITPTLKIKRASLMAEYKEQIDAIYQGHGVVTSK